MPHVRCSRCRGRSTLARHPKAYIRIPRCKHCRRRMEYEPISRRTPHYYVDRYRTRKERGRGAILATCYPGRGGCNGYSHPHRKGGGYCFHNPNLTDEMLRDREQGGGNWS